MPPDVPGQYSRTSDCGADAHRGAEPGLLLRRDHDLHRDHLGHLGDAVLLRAGSVLPVCRALAADASRPGGRVGADGMKRLVFIGVVVAHFLAANCMAATGTDLFEAVRAGDVEKVKALLQADPKLAEARTEDGSTALHLAALEGHADIARLLLASKAQVNARGLREETPLHMAMYDGHRSEDRWQLE